MAYLQRLEYAVPLGSLESYIHWVNQIPMLSAEEEHKLATQYAESGDVNAAKHLIMPYLRYVVKVARGYSGYGLAQSDLIQEGNIGLMKAVKRFDPNQGVRLVSFAIHWIKAEIHDFILRNWRIVKVATTKAQRKLFFNLRKATEKWHTAKMISENLDVKESDVTTMQMRLQGQDISYDTPVNPDNEASAPIHYLEAPSANPEHHVVSADWTDQREHNLYLALESLDDRSRDILENRWLAENKATLHELADKHQVSAERIRQLENQAMKKIKNALLSS